MMVFTYTTAFSESAMETLHVQKVALTPTVPTLSRHCITALEMKATFDKAFSGSRYRQKFNYKFTIHTECS